MTVQRQHILGIGLAALVFAADQLIKWLMVGPLQLQIVRQIYLLPIFNLTWTENYGVSLGLFTAESDTGRWILVGVTAAIAAFVAIWVKLTPEKRVEAVRILQRIAARRMQSQKAE